MAAKSLSSSQIADIKQKLYEKKKIEYQVSRKTISRLSLGQNSSSIAQPSLVRKQQVNLTVQQKLKIIEKLEKGETVKNVAALYKVDPSTIRRTNTRKSEVLKRALDLKEAERKLDCKKIRGEDSARDMALYKWLKQQRSLGAPLSGDILKAKALELNKIDGSAPDFTASNGWLESFKKRYEIRQLSMQGEKLSSDTTAAETFKSTLQECLKKHGYSEDVIYNADETGLYYKSLPTKTLAAGYEKQASGSKGYKDRVTVMCCANASGSHKITPLIIGKSVKPRCFGNCDMSKLPVKYTNSRSAWMNKGLFLDWFKNVFIKEVQEKHSEKTNVLLLLDNAPSHPAADELNEIDVMVRVLFLPPNVTALIQPMDQGVIEKMKKMYKKNLVKELILQELATKVSILQLVKQQTVKHCCYKLASSWDEVNARDLRNAWNRLLGKNNSSYQRKASPEEVNLLMRLLRDSPEYADCSYEMVQTWIEEDWHENGWRQYDVNEIYHRITSPENYIDEGEEGEEEETDSEQSPASCDSNEVVTITTEEAYDACLKLRTFLEGRWESTSTQINNIQDISNLILNIFKPV